MVDDAWKNFDDNGNGRLEKEEAFKFLTQVMKEVTGKDPSEKELERNFQIMDLDKSGDIDKEEAFKFLKGFKVGHILKSISSDLNNKSPSKQAWTSEPSFDI